MELRTVVVADRIDLRQFVLDVGSRGTFGGSGPNRERPETDAEAPRVQPVTSNHMRSEKGVYLPLTIGRRKRLGLLDTGSETTLVPYSWVQGRKLSSSDQILRAANGSEIGVKGEIRLKVRVGGLTLPMDCIVVDDVREMLVGMDWVSKYVETMDFRNQRAVVFGRKITLKRVLEGVLFRRIQLREMAWISPKRGIKAERSIRFEDSVCCESICFKPDGILEDAIPCELEEVQKITCLEAGMKDDIHANRIQDSVDDSDNPEIVGVVVEASPMTPESFVERQEELSGGSHKIARDTIRQYVTVQKRRYDLRVRRKKFKDFICQVQPNTGIRRRHQSREPAVEPSRESTEDEQEDGAT